MQFKMYIWETLQICTWLFGVYGSTPRRLLGPCIQRSANGERKNGKNSSVVQKVSHVRVHIMVSPCYQPFECFRGGGKLKFTYWTSFQTTNIEVEICEPTFFTALGGGKTSQWFTAIKELTHGPKELEIKIDLRASFKKAQVRAYIRNYIDSCEQPPGKNMSGKRILPFPNVEQFYQEYTLSFTPSFLALIRYYCPFLELFYSHFVR